MTRKIRVAILVGLAVVFLTMRLLLEDPISKKCTLVPYVKSHSTKNLIRTDAIVGGSTTAVFVKGRFAYVGISNSLVILDISDLTKPRQLGYIFLDDFVHSISSIDDIIFTSGSTWPREPHIVDVSDPNNPVEMVCQEGTALPSLAVATFNNGFAYTPGNGFNSLDIYNVISPTTIVEVATFKSLPHQNIVILPKPQISSWTWIVSDVAVADQYAYVAEYISGLMHRIRILDISDPTNPTLVGTHKMVGPGVPLQILISGNYLYISDEVHGSTILLDISDPKHLVQFDEFAGPEKLIVTENEYAYFTKLDIDSVSVRVRRITDQYELTETDWDQMHWVYGTAKDIFIVDNYAYFAAAGLRIVDVSIPFSPVEVSATSFSVFGSNISGLSVMGNIIYTARNHNGLGVVNIERVDSGPNTLSHLDLFAKDISINNSQAFIITDDSELAIVDVSNPSELSVISTNMVPELQNLSRVAVDSDYAYILDTEKGIKIVDISNPTAILDISSFIQIEATDYYSDIAIYNNYLYIITHQNSRHTLRIFDVFNPAQPVEVGTYRLAEIPGIGENVAADQRFVYIAAGETLQVIDIQEPKNPIELGVYELPFPISDLDVVDDNIYITYSTGGLAVFRLNADINGG